MSKLGTWFTFAGLEIKYDVCKSVIESGNKAIKLTLGPCSAESPRQLEDTIVSLGNYNRFDLSWCGNLARDRAFSRHGEPAPRVDDITQAKSMGSNSVRKLPIQHTCRSLSKTWGRCVVDRTRTTVNPFYVQEIADAFKRDKNPCDGEESDQSWHFYGWEDWNAWKK